MAQSQEKPDVEQGGLERKMETRHLTMISLGGVIGTGLFLSSGYTIHQAGPLGAIIAYAIGSLLVYFIMLSLGELSVAMPYAGSFCFCNFGAFSKNHNSLGFASAVRQNQCTTNLLIRVFRVNAQTESNFNSAVKFGSSGFLYQSYCFFRRVEFVSFD